MKTKKPAGVSELGVKHKKNRNEQESSHHNLSRLDLMEEILEDIENNPSASRTVQESLMGKIKMEDLFYQSGRLIATHPPQNWWKILSTKES